MSSTLEFYTSPFLTLVGKLFPYASDTLAYSGICVHQTNRIGMYLMSNVTGISGYHTGHFFQSGELIALGHVNIVDGQVCRFGDATIMFVSEVTEQTSLMGAGADTVTLTFTDGSNPIADADCWVTNDSAGNNVVAGTLQTNSSGQVTFLLDAGTTYYFFAQKDGYNSIRGTSFVAVAD